MRPSHLTVITALFFAAWLFALIACFLVGFFNPPISDKLVTMLCMIFGFVFVCILLSILARIPRSTNDQHIDQPLVDSCEYQARNSPTRLSACSRAITVQELCSDPETAKNIALLRKREAARKAR